MSASVLVQKGVCPQAVKKLSSEVGKLGHSEIVLKSDGEPSIVALKQRVKQERPERIVLEESPVKESQANGGVENAIRQVQGQIRTIKDCLQSRIGVKINGDEAIFPWLVSHAAATINRHHVGQDGKTAYQRWKGKPFRREITEFGETVLYLKMGTRGRDKLDSRWETGTWMGVKDDTGECIIGTDEG